MLLHVREGSSQELFLASLAQRVVVLSASGAGARCDVAALMQQLSQVYQQHHYTLVVDDDQQAARAFYRRLFEDHPDLLRIECELQVGGPDALFFGERSAGMASRAAGGRVLREVCGRGSSPLQPQGNLKLFWKSILFCSDCSLRLCRKVLSSEPGLELEACPLQRF